MSWRKRSATALFLTLFLASCGTRVEGSGSGFVAPSSASNASGSVVAPNRPDGPQLGGAAEVAPVGTPTTSRPTSLSAHKSSKGSPGTGAKIPSVSDQSPTSAPEAAAVGRSKDAPPRSPESPGSVPEVPRPSDRGVLSPMVVGHISYLSGPASPNGTAVTYGIQMWAKWVNTHGGIHGHPVRLVVYDAAADRARHRAQLQEGIERQHVIAFVSNAEALTGDCCVSYLEEK